MVCQKAPIARFKLLSHFEPNGLFLKNGLLFRVSHFSKVSRLVQNWLTLEKRLTFKSKPFSKVKANSNRNQ
jgi:hypothetical protein